MNIVRYLANLGYGSRREVEGLLAAGAVTNSDGAVLGDRDMPGHGSILVRGAPLDPPAPLLLMLHKPDGYTCSTEDPGDTIYQLLPPRFGRRKPGLNPIGRLDKDTTGLLLLTDDGQLLHRIVHPKSGCRKLYLVHLDRPLQGSEAQSFASGEMVLKSETRPLLPARLEVLTPTSALVTLHEGRYHQVRRMFAAVGNHVTDLKRIGIGGLRLPADLACGEWRVLTEVERAAIFQPAPA